MTDDLNARLARMETSLRHIEQDVLEAKTERADAVKQTQDFMARLVKLEAGDKALSGIPDRVAHTEATNEVQTALQKAYEEFERRQRERDRNLAQKIGIYVGVIVTLVTTLSGAAIYLMENGG